MKLIKRSMKSCEEYGYNITEHFPVSGKVLHDSKNDINNIHTTNNGMMRNVMLDNGYPPEIFQLKKILEN